MAGCATVRRRIWNRCVNGGRGASRSAPTKMGFGMKYDPHKHHRRSIRLKGYDYTANGWYFVTICVNSGHCVLGEVNEGEMILNEWGKIVERGILWLEEQYSCMLLDEYCIMPNHIHLIIVLVEDVGRGVSRNATKRKPLGRLIGAFKTTTTKKINELRDTPGIKFWQRDFYEHIIRNERALNAIRLYIINNPANWQEDKLNPGASPNPFNQDW